ncbi:MAG: hypothetical protein A2888_00570 [Chlamydiae bacterium RIFCSPLOWO2_01_FULL_28_7]|nr:MAG: hypothetical protein A2888_00570 [Chlamydiae bacterium RIFCSPLOWO2_01_FULL_28_7]
MKGLLKYITILFITFSLFSNETQERVPLGNRKLSEEELKELYSSEENSFNEKRTNFNDYKIYPDLIFNTETHNVEAISVTGDYLVIEDGSEWRIKPYYSAEIFNWALSDPIYIIENDSFLSYWFGGYGYKMINKRRNTYIEVKISQAPRLDSPYLLLVKYIDPMNKEIILSDNSVWSIDTSQSSLFYKFLENDAVIVGRNIKHGWFYSYENILINVNMLQNLRANRVK